MTGEWNLDVMLKNGDRSIAKDLNEILANHGYQSETAGADYIALGVNWGYTGAQLSENMDPTTLSVIAVMLVLIIFTGYLIILQCIPDLRGGGHPFLRPAGKPSAPRPAAPAVIRPRRCCSP